ncbi:MAG: hypothetical protein ACU0BC_02600 [Pseudooceanicola nanhaiensis]
MTTSRIALLVLAVVAGWVGVLALTQAASGDAPAALVLLPSRDFLAALPPDAAIVSESPVSVTVRHASPSNITPELYAAGAWLVLPAGNRGCAPE